MLVAAADDDADEMNLLHNFAQNGIIELKLVWEQIWHRCIAHNSTPQNMF